MSVDPSQVVLSRLSGVHPTGDGWTARCPAHDDRRNSLSISVAEDGKVLLKCHAGCEFKVIVAALGLEERDLFSDNPGNSGNGRKKIIETYNYSDEAGNLVYQVCRYRPKSFSQRRPDGKGGWIYNLRGISPLLYRLPLVIEAVQKGHSVCITEGEKDVHTLERMRLIATCNSGGAGKFPASMVRHFAGAKVVILPDNDDSGRKHALQMAALLYGVAQDIRIIELPGLPPKGDVTDWVKRGGTKEALGEIVRMATSWKPPVAPEPPLPVPSVPDLAAAPFRCLGYGDGSYFYLPHETKQIVALRPNEHTTSNLLALAPLSWWEGVFSSEKTIDWTTARDTLYRTCARQGVFDVRNLRGCGTWYDADRVVLHRGDHLVVNGHRMEIATLDTRFIYEAAYPQESADADLLSAQAAARLLTITELLSWDKPVNARLLAGWCAIAPICGALPWRPHIWLTGASGTGKTWVQENIIKPLLGSAALLVQSNSTEAGVRQALGTNAFPVLFDEAEGEDVNAQRRLQGVLELLRQASSETGAPIVKGTQSGRAMQFHIRSCFCLSSIGPNISQKADASRISVLTLRKHHPRDAQDHFDELSEAVFSTLTPEWCAGLRARAIHLIPTIVRNAQTFSRAAAGFFGDQRVGDQIGTLLAGAYVLRSDEEITDSAAKEWIAERDWSEQSVLDAEPDEMRCLNRLLQSVVAVTEDGTRKDRTIGKLVAIVAGRDEELDTTREVNRADAGATLARYGMRATDEELVVSNSHEGLRKLLRDSPWTNNWREILRRLEGTSAKTSFRFGSGTITRAIGIPLDLIFAVEA